MCDGDYHIVKCSTRIVYSLYSLTTNDARAAQINRNSRRCCRGCICCWSVSNKCGYGLFGDSELCVSYGQLGTGFCHISVRSFGLFYALDDASPYLGEILDGQFQLLCEPN